MQRNILIWLLITALLCLGSVLLASAGTDTYSYDKTGRLLGLHSANGQTIIYTYDLAGNVLTQRVTAGCQGDFEPDRDVDGQNLASLVADYGRKDCDQGELCEGDVDGDNEVDHFDLVVFITNFGRMNCPNN